MFVSNYAAGEASAIAAPATVRPEACSLELRCGHPDDYWYPRLEFSSFAELSAWWMNYCAGSLEAQDAMLLAKLVAEQGWIID